MTSPAPRILPRTFGPIRLSVKSVPNDGVRPRQGHWIDAGNLRGSLISITKTAAAAFLGASEDGMKAFISAGVIDICPRHTSSTRVYVLLDPGTCCRQLYENWVAKRGMPITHYDFTLHRTIRRMCQINASETFPEIVLEGTFRRLNELGIFTEQETNVFLPLNGNWRAVKDWFNARIGEHRRRRMSLGATVELSDFRASLPKALSDLPRSCFCRVRGLLYEAPSARIRQRLMAMVELFAPASLYCLFTAPRLRRPDQLREHIIAIERVEEVMKKFAPNRQWTAADYTTALRDYVLNGFARPQDVPSVRDVTVRIWRMVAYRIRLFVKQADHELQRLLQPYVPPVYVVTRRLRAEIIQKFGNLRQEGRANRKRDTQLALAELDIILEAATNRRDELKAFGDAFREVLDNISPDAIYEDFSVNVPIIDEKGSLVGGTQQVEFRAWRTTAAWWSLLGTDPSVGLKRIVQKRTAEKRVLECHDFVVEHLGTKGIGNALPIDPYMIQLDRLCVTHCVATAAPDLKEARHSAIIRYGLPGTRSISDGILNFGSKNSDLKRNALDAGRHFFPLEEVEHGIRLAFHMLDCVSQSFNRRNEIRQQVCRNWIQHDVIGDEIWHSQDVWPKVPKLVDLAQCEKVPLTLRESSLNEAIDLCNLHMRRCAFSEFPVIDPARDLKWKCLPDMYVISFNGRALASNECGFLFRYLLAGWPPFTLHDFRHVMAEDAALDGLHPALVAMLLSRTTIQNALYYMKLPSWARQVLRKAQLAARMDRQDVMAASKHSQAETDG